MPDDEDGKPTIDDIDLGDINVDKKPTEAKSKTRDESLDVGEGLD